MTVNFFQNNIPVSSWQERLQCGWRKSPTNWFVDIRSITRWIHKPKYYCIFIIISMGACFLLGSSRVGVVDLQNSFHGHSRKVCGFQRGITTSKHFVWWFHISLVVMQSQGTYNTFFFGPLSYITILGCSVMNFRPFSSLCRFFMNQMTFNAISNCVNSGIYISWNDCNYWCAR